MSEAAQGEHRATVGTPSVVLQCVASMAGTMIGQAVGTSLLGKLVAGVLGALVAAFLTAPGTRHRRRIVAVGILVALGQMLRRVARASASSDRDLGRRPRLSDAWASTNWVAVVLPAIVGLGLGSAVTTAIDGWTTDASAKLVVIPDVRSTNERTASRILAQARVDPVSVSKPSKSVRKGTVERTSPSAGAKVRPGSTVKLFVSSGAKTTSNPPADNSKLEPGLAEYADFGIPERYYGAEFHRIKTLGYGPFWIDGYEVNGDTFFNVIFRPDDGFTWKFSWGRSSAEYQSTFSKYTRQGFRLWQIESYLSSGNIVYAATFVDTPGPARTAYHGLSAADHQKRYDELTNDGWAPINISVVSVSGNRSYAALYEKRDVGSVDAESFLTPAEYRTKLDQNVAAGRHLAYINAYTHNGSPRITAIWHQKPAVNLVERHDLSRSQLHTEYRLLPKYLTQAVTGYEEADRPRFAAFFTK
jgi:hypothetical protein